MGYVAHAVSVFFFISCCVYSILLYYLAHASRRVRGELFFFWLSILFVALTVDV